MTWTYNNCDIMKYFQNTYVGVKDKLFNLVLKMNKI